MMQPVLRFRHVVMDADPPGAYHDICLVGDLNGDGLPDVVIGAKEGDPTLFWYENPSWQRHAMASVPNLEAGGVLLDVNRDGRLDVVAGQQIRGRELYWFECPADPRRPWTPHVIEDRFEKYHDQAVGDVDGDGEPELVVLSQKSRVLVYYDIPADPRVSPWPREASHVIAENFHAEGLLVVDIDGDGVNEIMAGTVIFRPPARPGGQWRAEPFAEGYDKTRVAAADLDGDGRLEIVVAEGESDRGRLAWMAPPDWKPRTLHEGLFHPHSLEIADFDGDGLPDIFVGEMDLGRHADPRLLVYRNMGAGWFQECEISSGVSTHEAKVADIDGDGRPDIVGKPYSAKGRIDLWLNETVSG